MKQKTALVAGVTGLVGNCLSELLPKRKWKVYGVARRPKPEWFVQPGVEYVQCDLLDRDDTVGKLSQLTDVTHIFWVVWAHKSDTDEQVNCEANGSMLCNTLEALLPVARQLEHICLQTGSKHYVGPESLWGKIKLHSLLLPFVEDSPRLEVPNFYYTLEDIVYSAVAVEKKMKKRQLTWSVHRPSVIFGFAPRSPINLVQSIAIYASVCKYTGLPFVFPGHREAWECGTDVSDAELIAEQEIWAATEATAKNQAYNVTNGDVITWKQLWTCQAAKFGIQVPVYSGRPTSVEAMLCDKEKAWEEIVEAQHLEQHSLRRIGRVMDEAFNFPFRLLSSNEKSRRFGFHGCRNTEESLLSLIDKMRANGIIPP